MNNLSNTSIYKEVNYYQVNEEQFNNYNVEAKEVLNQIETEIADLKSKKNDSKYWELKKIRQGPCSKFSDHQLDIIVKSRHVSSVRELKENEKNYLTQVLDIKKCLGDDYYVFTHGQSAKWNVVATLIKEILRLEHPTKDLSYNQFLRHPLVVNKDLTVSDLMNSDWDDHHNRKDLLSVDSYIFNTTAGESTFHFINKNRNVYEGHSEVAKEVIKFYIKNPEIVEKIDEKIQSIFKDSELFKLANLVTFCIPKNEIAEMGYLSLPYGEPCKGACGQVFPRNSSHKEIIVPIADPLQAQQELKLIATDGLAPEIPTYRLLTGKLLEKQLNSTTDKRIYSFTIHLLEKKIRKEYKLKIREIAREIYYHKLVEDKVLP